MSETCKKCGLPTELCICETISKETQKIKIQETRKRFGKTVTMIKGIDSSSIDIPKLLKKLKSKLSCGGTYKDGVIELQGKHTNAVKKLLVEEGFNESSLDVS